MIQPGKFCTMRRQKMTYTLNKKKKNPDYFLEGKDESSVWSSALQSEPLLELPGRRSREQNRAFRLVIVMDVSIFALLKDKPGSSLAWLWPVPIISLMFYGFVAMRGFAFSFCVAIKQRGFSFFMKEKLILYSHNTFLYIFYRLCVWLWLVLNSLDSNWHFTFSSNLSILGLFTYFVHWFS